MDKYDVVRNLGSGSFGVTKLMRNSVTDELFAVKFLQRGPAIDENVAKEIINHRSLRHPNIIRFHEVALTPTHLAVKMEYAAGGNLLQRIQEKAKFSEDEARYFFQQLISGISYSHMMQVSHRDLKLENILLDGSPAPRLKICDFGFSTSSLLHSRPRDTVGTQTYIAPEVYTRREYDGKLADVWSCGVVLYVMLVGAYPFEKREDPENSSNLIKRILRGQYEIPEFVQISQGCREILSRIFVTNPSRRIAMNEIRGHPWFLKNLPRELTEAAQAMHFRREQSIFLQSVEEIMKIIDEAKIPPLVYPFTINVGGNETDDYTSDDNAEIAVDVLQVEFDEKIDFPTRISSLNSGEDIVGARATKLVRESKPIIDNRLNFIFSGDNKDEVVGTRATKLVQESKPIVDNKLKFIFSGGNKDEVVGTRATEFVQGKATKEEMLPLTFSNHGGDIVGTRATKLGEENSSNHASNARETDMLGERATLFQSESRKVGLASFTISTSSGEKEDVVGAGATKHTFSKTSGLSDENNTGTSTSSVQIIKNILTKLMRK